MYHSKDLFVEFKTALCQVLGRVLAELASLLGSELFLYYSL